jgi:hypothetical protein
MATDIIITDIVLMGVLIVLRMAVVYLIIREIWNVKTSNRTIELELDRDKLKLLQQKLFPFTRLSFEQTA